MTQTPFGSVAIGARLGGGVDPVFVKCYTGLIMAGMHDGDRVLPPAIELPHHWAANVLAHEFLTQTDCDSLLMLDDDMTFSRDALESLRSSDVNQEFGIVQGLCVSAKAGHGPLMLAESGDYYVPMRPELTDSTVEVGMVGLAFTLIRRSVFAAVDAIKPPEEMYFTWGASGTGEDAWFCKRARVAGVRIGVDTTQKIGHRVPVNIFWDTEQDAPGYNTYRNQPFMDLLTKTQNANKEE